MNRRHMLVTKEAAYVTALSQRRHRAIQHGGATHQGIGGETWERGQEKKVRWAAPVGENDRHIKTQRTSKHITPENMASGHERGATTERLRLDLDHSQRS